MGVVKHLFGSSVVAELLAGARAIAEGRDAKGKGGFGDAVIARARELAEEEQH